MNNNIIHHVWHWKVEDGCDWKLCAEILKQDGVADFSGIELKKYFITFFKNLVGIEPYTKCPSCGEKLLPRKSRQGYFVGCSNYPSCKFMATNDNPYKKIKG